MDNKLKIEYMPIDKLTHYSRNAKIHTKEQITHIANSIKEFGFNDPIGIAGEENTILEGNGRIEAAKLLGMTVLPCIRLDFLSEDERQAYVIAHNSVNLETGFDDGTLYAELKKLQNYDFKDFGLNTDKFLKTFIRVQKRLLKNNTKVYYLISADINDNDKILDLINRLKSIPGVEIDSTTN